MEALFGGTGKKGKGRGERASVDLSYRVVALKFPTSDPVTPARS